MPWFHKEADSISRPEVEAMCKQLLDEAKKRLGIKEYKRVLLLPPDLTRAHAAIETGKTIGKIVLEGF